MRARTPAGKLARHERLREALAPAAQVAPKNRQEERALQTPFLVRTESFVSKNRHHSSPGQPQTPNPDPELWTVPPTAAFLLPHISRFPDFQISRHRPDPE